MHRSLPALLVFYATIAILYAASHLIPDDVASADFIPLDEGIDVAIQSIDSILTMAQGLTLGLFGGCAALLYSRLSAVGSVQVPVTGLLALSISFGAAALYGVVLCYNTIFNFALADAFPSDSVAFNWGLWIVYHSVLLSAVSLASATIIAIFSSRPASGENTSES